MKSYKPFKLTQQTLKKEFDALNEEYFGVMDIVIKLKRMKSASGRCRCKRYIYSNKPLFVAIDISASYTYKNREQFVGILLHEMIHARLNLDGYIRHGHGIRFHNAVEKYKELTGHHIPLNNDLFQLEGTDSVSIETDKKFIALVVHDAIKNKYYSRPVSNKAFKPDVLTNTFRDQLNMDKIYFIQTNNAMLNTLSYITKPNPRTITLVNIPNGLAKELLDNSTHIEEEL